MANKLEFEDVPRDPKDKADKGNWRCGYYWKEGTVFVTRVTGPVVALVYMAGVNIDFDGSPTAYGPPSKPGDDKLEFAGPGKGAWYGVKAMTPEEAKKIRDADEAKMRKKNPSYNAIRPFVDEKAKKDKNDAFPVIQQAGEPSPGHYVSSTSTPFNASFKDYRQEFYWDSSKYPYGALSGKLGSVGKVLMHDFGLGIRLDRAFETAFCFKDAGNDDYAVGEVSQKVHKNLGGRGKGDNDYRVAYIVFPGSNGGKKATADQFDPEAKKLLGKLAKADNAEELALLLAFYADAGMGRSGLPLLEAFRQKRGAAPSLANLRHVLAGLRRLDWPKALGPVELEMERQKMHDYMEPRQLRSDRRIDIA
jgi:hypothetical protein